MSVSSRTRTSTLCAVFTMTLALLASSLGQAGADTLSLSGVVSASGSVRHSFTSLVGQISVRVSCAGKSRLSVTLVGLTGVVSATGVNCKTPVTLVGTAAIAGTYSVDMRELRGYPTSYTVAISTPLGTTPTTSAPTTTTTITPTTTTSVAPSTTTTTVPPTGAGSVVRCGAGLCLNGQPYRFLGVNAFQLATYWQSNRGCGGQTNDLDAFFSSLRPNSMVRFWAFQDLAINRYSNARDWTGIDRVVDAAERNGQRLILTIGDHWNHCDGSTKDTAWYGGGYRTAQNVGDGIPRVAYWDWMRAVVARYKNSPAVGMWELVNEPEVACGYTSVLRTFFDTVGAELKRIDPAHLISSGVLGGSQCGLAGTDYVSVHQSPAIDVASFHDYGADSSPLGWQNYVQYRLDQMKAIGKPLMVGEAGIYARDGVAGCNSLTARRDMMRAKLDAQFAAGVVGFLLWDWSESPSPQCDHYISPGDPVLNLFRGYSL